MAEKLIELSIEIPAEVKRAIERAAAERGLSVSDFLAAAVRKRLVDTGYIDERAED